MTRAVLCCLVAMVAAGACLAVPPVLTAAVVPQGPALKGDLSDPLWQKAAKAPAFIAADGISQPQAATEA